MFVYVMPLFFIIFNLFKPAALFDNVHSRSLCFIVFVMNKLSSNWKKCATASVC